MTDLKKPVSIGLSGKQRALLEELAERFKVSKSAVVGLLLETYAAKSAKEIKDA